MELETEKILEARIKEIIFERKSRRYRENFSRKPRRVKLSLFRAVIIFRIFLVVLDERIPINLLILNKLVIKIQQVIEIIHLHRTQSRKPHRHEFAHILLRRIAAKPVAAMDSARIDDFIFGITERKIITEIQVFRKEILLVQSERNAKIIAFRSRFLNAIFNALNLLVKSTKTCTE